MRLVTYLASSVEPTRHKWLSKLNALLEKFFRQEIRTNIRVKVLGVLDKVIQTNRCAITYSHVLDESFWHNMYKLVICVNITVYVCTRM